MKIVKYRRWVLVNTFLTLLMLGFILVLGGNRSSFLFEISAPFSLAILGTYLIDNLLSYFESVREALGRGESK